MLIAINEVIIPDLVETDLEQSAVWVATSFVDAREGLVVVVAVLVIGVCDHRFEWHTRLIAPFGNVRVIFNIVFAEPTSCIKCPLRYMGRLKSFHEQ